jgi:adenylate cyclase
MRRFLAQLRQRNVFKVGLVYLIAGWLAMQIADVMFPALGLPDWSLTLVAALLIVGFPIALVMAWALELTPDGLKLDKGALPAGEPASPSDEAVPPAAEPGKGESIAVLPFLDFSPDKDNEHFVDGLTEELLNSLAHIGGLKVSSRSSSFALKGKDIDIPSVAQKLGVVHILEGSVRKAGDRVRITAQLIHAQTDSHLWSETYDRQLDDIFAIQRDIATQIVSALSLTFRPQDLGDATTRDPRAYDYYLRGRGYVIYTGSRNTKNGIRMFSKAVEIDPLFVRAWSDLAWSYAILALYHGGGGEAVAEAERASQRAVALGPDRAETHATRGLALVAADRFEEAAASFERAIGIDPGLANTYSYYGRALFHQGLKQRAAEMFGKAAEADPEDYENPSLASQVWLESGDTERGMAAARRAVANAERHLQDYPDNPRPLYLGASALMNLGETERAYEWAERALELAPTDGPTRYNLACVYALAGDKDRAFECLENSITSRSWIENDPELASLRDDPRFQAILDRLD